MTCYNLIISPTPFGIVQKDVVQFLTGALSIWPDFTELQIAEYVLSIYFINIPEVHVKM